MFGDVFKTRADYSSGDLYQAHRKFLRRGRNHLEPPEDFKTKTQMRHALLMNGEKQPEEEDDQHASLKSVGYMVVASFLGSNAPANRKASGLTNRMKRAMAAASKVAPPPPQKLIINRFSSTRRADWNIEHQAGCTIYVNKRTGEVVDECPWAYVGASSLRSLVVAGGSHLGMSHDAKTGTEGYQEEEELGTGALVYDGSELEDLFALLDQPLSKSQQKMPQHQTPVGINNSNTKK